MYATDFIFDGKKLSDFGMMVCKFNNDSGANSVSIGSEITFNQVKTYNGNRFYLTSSDYQDAYTTTIQCCKLDNQYLSPIEFSQMVRWVCKENRYGVFKIVQEDYESIYWNVICTCKAIKINEQIAGAEITITTDSIYALMEQEPYTFTVQANTPFTIQDTSYRIGKIAPKIEIVIGQTGNFVLKNDMEPNHSMSITNCTNGENIIIDGEHQIITTDKTTHNLSTDFNYAFLHIVNTDESRTNNFTANMDCTIMISYSPIIFVGI